jgi:hypothetical protein
MQLLRGGNRQGKKRFDIGAIVRKLATNACWALSLTMLFVSAPPVFAVLPVTTGLQLWFEAGNKNYQTITNNPGTVDMTTVVGPASNAGDRVGAALNLADDPAIVTGGLWSPPAQQTVISPTDRRPVLQDINGVKAWRMDGAVGQTLVSIHSTSGWGSVTQLATDTQSWFLVYRPSTEMQTSTMLFTTTGNNNTSGVIRVALNAGTLEVAADPSATSNFSASTLSAPASLTSFSIVSVIMNGSTMEAFQNGVSLGTVSGLSGTPGYQRTRIGGSSGNANPFTGDMTVVLGYNVALNGTDRQAIEDYLLTNLVPSTSVTGDYNADGKVDAADYVIWRKTPENFNNDQGYIDWRANFGAGAGSGASAAVPEPSCMCFGLVLGVVAALCSASRRVR